MIPKNLEEAVRKSWGRDTCYPPSANNWTPENPAFGQCAVTALAVRDYVGGQILNCKSLHHYYNLLDDGTIVDLTESQFPKGTLVQSDGIANDFNLLYNESAVKAETERRYKILKRRVEENLACASPNPLYP